MGHINQFLCKHVLAQVQFMKDECLSFFFFENHSRLSKILLFIHDLAWLTCRLDDMQVYYGEKNKREAANKNHAARHPE